MIGNKRIEAGPAPLRVLYVTAAPDVPRMRRWLGVLAATLKGDGNVLVVACPDGSLSEAALVEDDAGQLGYVYATIRGWRDLAGWFQWMTLLRRLRPHSVQLADDLDAGAALRLALATRLAGSTALLVEARSQREACPRARLAGGLGPRLLYRVLPTLVLCDDARQAAALIQAYHIAPAHISLVSGSVAAEPAMRSRRATRRARQGRGARPAMESAAARARHLQALYQLLRGADMPEPVPTPMRDPVSTTRPVRAPQPPAPALIPTSAPRAWRPSGAPRLVGMAGKAGQGIEPAEASGRALVLNGSSARMSRVMRGTETR